MTNPFVANLIPGDPEETNLRYRAAIARTCFRDRTGCR